MGARLQFVAVVVGLAVAFGVAVGAPVMLLFAWNGGALWIIRPLVVIFAE